MFEAEVDCHLGQFYSPLESPQLENPYPFYERARSQEPVFYSEQLRSWVVTRYDDIRSILSRPDIFSSKDTLRPVDTWIPEVFQILATGYGSVPTMINTDGREHMRFRKPINQAFLPARIKPMESIIRALSHRLVDTFFKEGQTELMEQFAGPLPQEVILMMFGIPATDMAQCKHWSDDAHALTAAMLSPQRQLECARSLVALQHYLATLIEKRREAPGNDLVSCLLTGGDEHPFDMAEIVVSLLGLYIAGHQTTTNLIGTAVYLLLSQTEQWQRVCKHPQDIPLAIEEALRFDSPVPAFNRTALQEVQVGGVTIHEGDVLLLVYGAANRDEAQFPNADQFDLDRSPNRHLSFGHGVHFCAGAPLARLEGRIALEVLSQRLPELRLKKHQQLCYVPNLQFRGLRHLEVEWDIMQEVDRKGNKRY